MIDPTLSASDSQSIARTVLGFLSAPAASVAVESIAMGSTTWARDQITESSDQTNAFVSVLASYGDKAAVVTTTRLDTNALRAAAVKADVLARAMRVPDESDDDPLGPPGPPNAALWHDNALANLDPRHRLAVIDESRAAIDPTQATGVVRVGMDAWSVAALTGDGHFEYGRTSTATYEVTARSADGSGAGWAAWKGEDWTQARVSLLAARAAELAERTRRPVAVEPGHYTVVMAPAAFGALVGTIAAWGALDGRTADEGRSPFSVARGGAAFGRSVLGEQVTLSADPGDPVGGFLPFAFQREGIVQYAPATWVRGGVLERLAYRGAYARRRRQPVLLSSRALRMEGGATSIDAMIASTQRGIYVTRFSDVSLMSFRTFLMTGVTRDGTFLIENGRLTRPIKGLRFEDTPFRFLQTIEALGPAERVPLGSYAPYVMPCAKIRDLMFAGYTDAV